MRNSRVTLVLLAALALTAAATALAQESDPVAVLKSDASYREKEEACRRLHRAGDRDAIPVLKEMLTDEKLSHMARYALQSMPYEEAGRALREALATTEGDLKVGVIYSLGAREDQKALPALIDVLSRGRGRPAQAAARALGRIGTGRATEALMSALRREDRPAGVRKAVWDSLLRLAEKLRRQGRARVSRALCESLLDVPDAPQQVRSGALRGAVLSRSEDGLRLLAEALHVEDRATFAAAVRVSMEMGGEEVSAALADELSELPPARRVPVIRALGERGDSAAGRAVLALAEDAAGEVRLAALGALTRMGYAPALDLLSELAWSAEGEVAEVARDSLAHFPGDAADAAIREMLESDEPEARRVAIELIGRGALEEPVGVLMETAREGDAAEVRAAALKALGRFAGREQVPELLECLLTARSEEVVSAAEGALATLCVRLKARTAPENVKVRKAVYGVLPDGPSADVTKKVARMVASGKMTVEATNGNFDDPARGQRKKLRVDYTVNGVPVSKTVPENEAVTLSVPSAPPEMVDALVAALERADGPARPALLRVLRAAGGPEALEAVRAVARGGEGRARETALRALCEWPTPEALPTVMELAQDPPNARVRALALRGAVRLLKAGGGSDAELLERYSVLMENARSAAEKRLVLSGLADVQHPGALELALCQVGGEVRAEAVQAAVSVAGAVGRDAREATDFFNGRNLDGWEGEERFWSVEDGAVVGRSREALDRTRYLWAPVTVGDFYLRARVQLEPETGNSGIQFRSKKKNERGDAFGHQADVGKGVWGRLYHQDGRGKLAWPDRAEDAVRPGGWNTLEVLAVGPAIWTTVNGQLCVACVDPEGARSGRVAFQLHQGPPQTGRFRIEKLVHDPKLELGRMGAGKLIKELSPVGR